MLYLWKKVRKKVTNDKNYRKFRDHSHFKDKYGYVAHSIYNLRFNVLNETPVAFHNGSNYDYHFIIKELAREFEGQFNGLGKAHTGKNPFSFQ